MQQQTIPEALKFSPFFVFFLVVMMQLGSAISGFQKYTSLFAGYDSWQAVIFAGVTANIIMWFIFKQAEMVKGDVCDIHWAVFGKWVGGLFNLLLAIYYLWYAITILRNYIEIVQVWMFPDLSTFWFTVSYLLLCIYIIFGGIRTIVGIAFFSIALTFYIIYLQGYTIPFSDFRHFFPLFNHSFNDVLKASENMSFSITGYETILIYYTFIKSSTKSKKWGQLALIFTTIIYLFTAFLTFAYFAQDELNREIWPTLTLYKIVKLPVVERFEYIGVANWCFIILPSVCLSLWCASRLLKRTTKLKMKYGVFILSLFVLFGCIFLKTKSHITILNEIINNLGFILDHIYIPILFVLLCLIMKVKTKRKA